MEVFISIAIGVGTLIGTIVTIVLKVLEYRRKRSKKDAPSDPILSRNDGVQFNQVGGTKNTQTNTFINRK